jgi:pyruvate dehydrogenase phosphatase
VYLKKPQLNKDLFFSHGGVAITFKKPVLSAEPSLHEKVLTANDRFLIFASDGLWEQVTEQEAVEIVQRGSRDV